MKCLVVFSLYLVLHTAIGADSRNFLELDNLCLNGSRDSEGRCVCKAGYSTYRGNCFQIQSPDTPTTPMPNRSCPSGYKDYQNRCVPTTCTGTLCDSSCPPGYVLNKGFCEVQNPSCPPNTYFKNGFCHYQAVPPNRQTTSPIEKIEVVPPLRIDIPVPEIIDPIDSNEIDPNEMDPNNISPNENDDDDIEIVPDRRPNPGENIVHNVNTVNAPTNVTSHNINNIFIHISRHRSDGSIKAVVIRNNETSVYEEKPPTKQESDEPCAESVITEQPQENKCCIIVSPRICRKQDNEWTCFHRKHYRCGPFCTSNIMYLKPQRPLLRNSSLIMPPKMNNALSSRLQFGHCRWGVCPSIDCSGCLRGSYRCHIQCYTYDCAQQGGCNFVNHDDYCDDNDDELCTVDN